MEYVINNVMRKDLKYIASALSIAILLIISGCKKDDSTIIEDMGKIFPSLIEEYVEPNEIILYQHDNGTDMSSYNPQFIVKGEKYTRLINPTKYADLQNEWNDIWGKGIRLHTQNAFSFIPYKLMRISIITLEDYNDTHPAGSSLDDIFSLRLIDMETMLKWENKTDEYYPSCEKKEFECGKNIGGYFVNSYMFRVKEQPNVEGNPYNYKAKIKVTMEFENKTLEQEFIIPRSFIL